MILEILFLISGLALILLGANMLTDGAAAIARRFGISDLVVGLTVVAFGTSAPELIISLISAINGSSELAIGNVVGSNIFNVLVIVGLTAAIRPISVSRGILTADIPLVIVAALALAAMGMGPWLGAQGPSILGRADGIVLLLFFCVFMRYVFASASSGLAEEEPKTEEKPMPVWKAICMTVLGLAALIFGGDKFVDGASGIASAFGVSDAVIGLTIVAMGTSLPELATSVTAALKGRTGIAVGNVIGSNIFNIFMVLGASATVRELPFGGIGMVDLCLLVGVSLLFWLSGRIIGKHTITRSEGAVFVLIYAAYIAWTVIG